MMIKFGDRSEQVRQLQQKLGITADGIFGPVTMRAVMLYQLGNGLAPNGIADANTLKKLGIGAAQPNINPVMKLALDIAIGEIGTVEIPKNSNKGPRVEQYLSSVGLAPGNPYCAAFIHWCCEQAASKLGMENPIKRTGYCPTMYNGTDKDARFRYPAQQPQAGDLFFVYSSSKRRLAHVGFVRHYLGNGQISTAEGNTNSSGSREGGGVWSLTRQAEPLRFVRII